MIVLFFFLCIVLGLAIAPILVFHYRKKNNKIINRLKEIRTDMDDVEIKHKQALLNNAIFLRDQVSKTPDVLSKKIANEILEDIRHSYYAGDK